MILGDGVGGGHFILGLGEAALQQEIVEEARLPAEEGYRTMRGYQRKEAIRNVVFLTARMGVRSGHYDMKEHLKQEPLRLPQIHSHPLNGHSPCSHLTFSPLRVIFTL